MKLTETQVIDFLKTQKLMIVATSGDFPWIANVYFTFDDNLNLYFFSDPNTLHCRQIAQNGAVAVSIVDSHQDVSQLKRGLQISGIAEQISDMEKIKQSLKMSKEALGIINSEISYKNILQKVIKGRMYKIVPKRIKLFDQELFDVEDGKEPVLEL
jgi:uncharacterized protein YhbP (UPF0306 family)